MASFPNVFGNEAVCITEGFSWQSFLFLLLDRFFLIFMMQTPNAF